MNIDRKLLSNPKNILLNSVEIKILKDVFKPYIFYNETHTLNSYKIIILGE